MKSVLDEKCYLNLRIPRERYLVGFIWDLYVENNKVPSYIVDACSAGYQKLVPGNFEIPRPDLRVLLLRTICAQKCFFLEEPNCEMT